MTGRRRLIRRRGSVFFFVVGLVMVLGQRGDWRVGGMWRLTSARCCWPVPKVLSLRAVGVLLPDVANLGVFETEALVDG